MSLLPTVEIFRENDEFPEKGMHASKTHPDCPFVAQLPFLWVQQVQTWYVYVLTYRRSLRPMIFPWPKWVLCVQ
jgi:hypothetical protein